MPGESGLSLTDERRFERLPEQVRRWQRFGGMEAAALAEAVALRREIDGLAARYSRWQAACRAASDPLLSQENQPTPATWLHLRRAGLALLAEIDRQRSINCIVPARIDHPATDHLATDRPPSVLPANGAADCATSLPARRHA